MQFVLFIVVLVFAIPLIAFATPLIIYIAPIVLVGLLINWIVAATRHHHRPSGH